MSEIVQRLVQVYRQEVVAYERVLELAREAVRAAREGRPLAELHELNLAKRDCLARVGALEASIAAEKRMWRERQRDGWGAEELDALLSRLTQLIQEILECERECDRCIVEGAQMGDLEAVAS